MMFKTLLSVVLFAASVLGIQFTNWPPSIEAGQTYTFTWTTTDASTPVTILLRQGEPNNLQTVGTITSDGTGGSYSWTAPTTYPPGADYAFQIVQGSEINYSAQISYTGGTGSAPSSPGLPSATQSFSVSNLPSISSAIPSSNATVSLTSFSTSGFSNSTTTKSSSSLATSTRTVKTTPAAPTASAPTQGNMATGLRSPVALVLGVAAAMLYLQ